ncbi:MAG: hypothetical protein ALECFALPRED_010469 [Alectoria fallacina]|uniref:Uncharacterized protein n=1 Tax=Alectoria fallacina TaxID=1903189 RepID=A0A8H3F858_9LECA|nr:MAG: hypothetical protein ALECFALPRED_010469 [Alectoria fallacina]
MVLKSIMSGNLVEAKIKQRQSNFLGPSPTDPSTCRPNLLEPTSSKKYSAPRRRGSEVEDTETPSFDQVFDSSIGTSADPIPILEEQRRDIDRIMASVNILQQDMISLRKSVEHLEDQRDQESHDFVGDVDILTDSITRVGSRLGELDVLNLEMKMMQQRIKRMEESNSTGRRSSTVLGYAQQSRRSSPTTDEQTIPRNDASSNGLLSSVTQTPLSACFDGLFAPRRTAFKRPDVVDGGDLSYQRPLSGSKDESLPTQIPSTIRPKSSVNATASKGSHTPVNMPPPQIPPKGPEQRILRRSSSIASNVATRTASKSVTGTTNSTGLPRLVSQMQEASRNFHQGHQGTHTSDDELVNDIHPRSSTGHAQQPGNNTAHSRQNRTDGTTQQHPPKRQRRRSVPMHLSTLDQEKLDGPDAAKANDQDQQTRGHTTHHDSKRRKTTAFNTDTPSTSIWATDPISSRRDEQRLSVRIDGDANRRFSRFQAYESKGRKRPGERDKEGYLLKSDGTRDPRSVKSIDRSKKKKAEAEAEAELSG